jgi:hypothetical protein
MIGVKIPRWCFKPFPYDEEIFNLRIYDKVKFEHVKHLKPINFIHLFPTGIELRRLVPDEEQQLLLLQEQIKHYMVLQTGTQITVYDRNTDMEYSFLVGDMYDHDGNQMIVGLTYNQDISLDLQFPTDPEEIAKKEKELKEKEEAQLTRMNELKKQGKLMGFSTLGRKPEPILSSEEVFEKCEGKKLE